MELLPLRMVPVRAVYRIKADYGRRPEWFEPGTPLWILRALNENLWLAFRNAFWRVPADRLLGVRPAVQFDCCPPGPQTGTSPQPIPGDIGFVQDARALRPESAGTQPLEDDHPVIFVEWFRSPEGSGMARVADGRLFVVRPRAVEFILNRPGETSGPSRVTSLPVHGVKAPVEVVVRGRRVVARDAQGPIAAGPTVGSVLLSLAGYAGPLEVVSGGMRETLSAPATAPARPAPAWSCRFPTSIDW